LAYATDTWEVGLAYGVQANRLERHCNDSLSMGKSYMDMNQFPVFRMMASKMNWLAERQTVLSQNVANADTPNYRPKDLKELDFKDAGAGRSFKMALARTHESHLAGAAGSSAVKSESQNDTYETNPAGNGVVLEEQLIKVGQTRHEYSLMTRLYGKQKQMFSIALGRQQG
jgi:flagellar basal-body rod protein FlgB